MTQHAEITLAAIVVLDETNMLSLAAAVDPLRAANRQAGRPLFAWQFLTPKAQPVTLTSGVVLPAAPLARCDHCDLLIVVAGFLLEEQAQPPLLAGLRRLAQKARLVAAIDGGPWVLARAGLLDGHRATTHWEDLDRFAERFPAVEVVNARYVESGNRATSGGAAPALDMMLHLIGQRLGPGLARRVAGSFIHDTSALPSNPQARRMFTGPRTPLLRRAHAVMEAHLDAPIRLDLLARQLGVSLRTLQAHFQQHLGQSPQAHWLALRLDEADRRVTETDEPLQQIALATGFQAQASFARAYRKRFGTSARARRKAARHPQ